MKKISYNKLDVLPPFDKRFKETFGLVEATSNESHELYFRFKQMGYDVEQISSGTGCVIGEFYGNPIFVNFRWYKINGVLVGFYECTSVIVNHYMIKTWIEKNLPHIKPGTINDAMNAHNTLRALGICQTVESVQNALLYEYNEYQYKLEQLNKLLAGVHEKLEKSKLCNACVMQIK